MVSCIARTRSELTRSARQVQQSAQRRHAWHVDGDTRDPQKIIYKVRHGSVLWCLVEYVNENDLDETKEYAWHCFNSDDEINAYAERASGEPLKLPELSLTPFEVERVVRNGSGDVRDSLSWQSFIVDVVSVVGDQQKKGLKEDLDRVQEEFRRYRVRSGIRMGNVFAMLCAPHRHQPRSCFVN